MDDGRVNSPQAQLKRELRGFQFIIISAVVGSGVFTDNGQALALAGPAGLIIAVMLLGLTALNVSETVSELVQKFPAPNAVFEYVATFIDEDLAWPVGIAYFYCFGTTFALQMTSAAGLLGLWDEKSRLDLSPTGPLPAAIFYGISPILLGVINFAGVKWFGWIETIGGALKSIILMGATITLWKVAGFDDANDTPPINAGFPSGDDWSKASYMSNSGIGFLAAVPIVAFSFIGIESAVMAAYEAKPDETPEKPKTRWQRVNVLKMAVRSVHRFIVALYILFTVGVALTIYWNDPNLAPPYGIDRGDWKRQATQDSTDWTPTTTMSSASTTTISSPTNMPTINSTNTLIIALMSNNKRQAPWYAIDFANACLIFCVLSAANTSLYIASRTLYGLTYKISEDGPVGRFFRTASITRESNRVPVAALLWTFILSVWLPFLSFDRSAWPGIHHVISTSASMSCLIVWAMMCLAHIRYVHMTQKFATKLQSPREDLGHHVLSAWPLLKQRTAAYLGLLGCSIVFVLGSGLWWEDRHDTAGERAAKVIGAYGAHIAIFLGWALLKLRRKLGGRSRPGDGELKGYEQARKSLLDLEDICGRNAYREVLQVQHSFQLSAPDHLRAHDVAVASSGSSRRRSAETEGYVVQYK